MLTNIGILFVFIGTIICVVASDSQTVQVPWGGDDLSPEPRQVPDNLKPSSPPPTSNSSGGTIHNVESNNGTEEGGSTIRPEPRQQLTIENTTIKPEPRSVNYDIQTISIGRQLNAHGRQSRRCQTNYAFNTAGMRANVESENYPRDYPNNIRTSICFSSPTGTTMNVVCDDFNVENEAKCSYDYFGISLSGDPRRITKYCGQGTLRSQSSSRNKLAIVFRSDSSNPSGSRSPYRFKCTVSVSGGSETTTTLAPPPPSGGGGGGDSKCQCGRKYDGSRIVGGSNARPGSLPWRCYLRTDRTSFFCGCSIISNNWILTAAHCSQAVQGQTIQVVVGDHDRSTTSEASSQQIPVAAVHEHPDYDDDTMDNDITLLKLSRSITYSDNIAPVCLPFRFRSESFANESVTASGWGRTTEGGSSSVTLKEVILPVLTTQQCSRYYPGQITENMICTYNPGKDTCQGDSGGSIDWNRGGRMYAIGVVSWGIGCARESRPGVYAKTTKYLDFIQRTTGEQFCQA